MHVVYHLLLYLPQQDIHLIIWIWSCIKRRCFDLDFATAKLNKETDILTQENACNATTRSYALEICTYLASTLYFVVTIVENYPAF